MNTYITLLRGINVGGKNKVSMAELKECLVDLGFSNVATYIASGNVILDSDKRATEVQSAIERALPTRFKLDSELIKVLVLSRSQLQVIVDAKPKGFGEQPGTYHSDVIFMMDMTVGQAMPLFSPREGVDKVWPGKGAVYSQRLSAERTKSRLSKITLSPLYKCMTIRSWATVIKLLEIVKK